MWLRSFERFFRIGNQPLSERETRAARPAELVRGAAARRPRAHAGGPAVHADPDRGAGGPHPLRPVRRDEPGSRGRGLDPYIEKLVRHTTPEAGARPCCGSPSRTCTSCSSTSSSCPGFPTRPSHSVGKILYREVRRSDLWPCSSTRSSSRSTTASATRPSRTLIRGIPDPLERRQAAKVFLELFRLLHYLELHRPRPAWRRTLRDTILLFSLITSETRLLLSYIERRVLKGHDAGSAPLPGLRLVRLLPAPRAQEGGQHRADRHLGDPPGRERAHPGRELPRHPEGLLPAVGGAARPGLRAHSIDGARIFPDFMAKREQSVRAARRPGAA